MYKKIGFIGLGLIGGSIAKTIKRIYENTKIVAVNHSSDSISLAYNEGIIDNDSSFPIENMKGCDLIFLCAPVSINIEYLDTLKQCINPDCILTDVGSVKGEMEEAVKEAGMEKQFIGGHPMCGSELIGYENAKDRLLENAYYILTNNGQVSKDSYIKLKEFVKSLGAIPIEMSVNDHDFVTGGVSHVPHIIASSLVNFVMNNDKKSNMKTVAAGGFKDITRIASSSPIMWQNICLTNKDKILELLDKYEIELDKFKTAIENSDSKEIIELFADAKEYRDSITTGKGMMYKVYEFYCDLADEAGSIATIATMLAANQLSIKNIGIINNREFTNGVLRIEMYDEESLEKAIAVLERNRYEIHR